MRTQSIITTEMQGLAPSFPPRCICVSSTRAARSISGFGSMANSLPFLPSCLICPASKLTGLVPCQLLAPLSASSRAKIPCRCFGALLHNDALFDESSVPDVDLTESLLEKAAEPCIPVRFVLQKSCKFGQSFNVVGSDPLLGSWDPLAGVPMKWSEGHVWTAELDVPLGKEIEFKFVQTGRGVVEWQPGQNRVFNTVETVPPLIVSEEWETVNPEGSLEVEETEVDITKSEGFAEGEALEAHETKPEALLEETLREAEGLSKEREPEVEVTKSEGLMEGRVSEAEVVARFEGSLEERLPEEKVLEVSGPAEPDDTAKVEKATTDLISGISTINDAESAANDGEKKSEARGESVEGDGRLRLSDSTPVTSHTESLP